MRRVVVRIATIVTLVSVFGFFLFRLEKKQRKFYRVVDSLLYSMRFTVQNDTNISALPFNQESGEPNIFTKADNSALKKGSINLTSREIRVPFNAIDHTKSEQKTTFGKKEKVCVLIPVSSKNQLWEFIDESFLVNYSLPSVARTSEPLLYNYTVFVGYDNGDPFFHNKTTLNSLNVWSRENIPFAVVKLLIFVNEAKKPGPVMNFLSRAAYDDGCDFLYRINDDTELLNPWTSAFVEALREFRPPFLGVVGPRCDQGNVFILTHDFVHRSHLDVFGTHYPVELTDWWLDDWITHVYGQENTRQLDDIRVQHHASSARYQIRWDNAVSLQPLLERGRELLAQRNGSAPVKLITYALYGDNPRYLDGALANAKLIREFFPGWTLRVYFDSSLPLVIREYLRNHSAQLVDMSGDRLRNKMAWRFLPAAERGIERFASRDVDSRLSAREAAAVREWEASGLPFHVMRDHPSHNRFKVSGGMWGSVGGAVSDIRAMLDAARLDQAYLSDMNFLNGLVWPRMQVAGVLVHDAFACDRNATRPFPTARQGVEHVGSVYLNGVVRANDASRILKVQAEGKCFR